MITRTIKFFLFAAVIGLLAPVQSFASLDVTFSDKEYFGGASWGTMTITYYDQNTLLISYQAAPDSVIPAGSQVTGFAFSFDSPYDPSKPPNVTNPPDDIFGYDRDELDWISFNDPKGLPQPTNRDEFTDIAKFNFLFGVTEGDNGNFNPPGILPGETDYFYLTFDFNVPKDDAGLAQFIEVTGIRLQSLPNDINGGSLFLAGAPVPIPSAFLLLGSGMLGLILCARKRMFC